MQQNTIRTKVTTKSNGTKSNNTIYRPKENTIQHVKEHNHNKI